MLGIHTWGKSNAVLKSGQVIDNLLKFPSDIYLQRRYKFTIFHFVLHKTAPNIPGFL